MRGNKFQIEVATGRFTLPVVILICLLLWSVTSLTNSQYEFVSLGIFSAISYLMIETNTAFTLIRTRTMLPVCMYIWLVTSFLFLHPYEEANWAPLAFSIALFNFFLSYESAERATPTYHSFLFLSLGSLVFPTIIYLVPLFGISMFPFRSISLKNLCAGLLGLLTPYWFFFAYALYFEDMPLYLESIQAMFHLSPIDFGSIPIYEKVSVGIVSLLLMVSCVHYWRVSYMDKTRTRIFLMFLTIAGLWITVLCFLQPIHLHTWMQLQLIPTAFLNGHLFTLTRNRFASIYFLITFIVLIFLTIYHLWMQYFSF